MIDQFAGVPVKCVVEFRKQYRLLGGSLPITPGKIKTLFQELHDLKELNDDYEDDGFDLENPSNNHPGGK